MEGRKQKAAGVKSLVGPLRSFIPSLNKSLENVCSHFIIPPFLLFSVHYNPEADNRVGVRRRSGGKWGDPVCSSGFGSIRDGMG